MKKLLDAQAMQQTLSQIAQRIAQDVPDRSKLRIVGVQRHGFYLAKSIAKTLNLLEQLGSLTINLYRDNLSEIGPQAKVTNVNLPFEVNNTHIVIVDDVFFTGRTIHKAVDALYECGVPETIRLAVLVSRAGFKKVPIEPEYVGLNLKETASDEVVKVKTADIDGVDEVLLVKKSEIML
ncbi:bifunctional pyr operon transcriptional regulator/uracil phosphoribosyltransferase PyrR [Candidatus Acetothermia bacterium]|nr:bifunctional pyr operon transcriptional regulator/uracil phosphoribosyltransferase PyrR [Candidatus Acetothermia bacterium]